MSKEPQPDNLGPLYTIRLGDLRSWHVVELRCFSCRHRGLVRPQALRDGFIRRMRRRSTDQAYIDHVVEHERLMDFTTRCQSCGNRAYNSLRVLKLPRNY